MRIPEDDEVDDVSPTRFQEPLEERKHHVRGRSRGKNSSDKSRRSHRESQSRQASDVFHERARRYLYAAISATFFFVLFREIGWVDQVQIAIMNTKVLRRTPKDTESSSISSLAAYTAANVATSSMKSSKLNPNGSAGQSSTGQLMGNSKNYVPRQEMMEFVTKKDLSITPGTRPIMYTFFEWIPPRSRGTSMSDVADKALITEWKKSWKAAGWHPIVLTLEDSKLHPNYEEYASKITKIPMLGVEGVGSGTVVYNQLCFYRWLAVAAAGGGFMSDYDVFPISAAPTSSLSPPRDGNFTVYCKIKNSKNAGIPCLMSGRDTEWTRMAFAILENGIKNSKTESMWSDMLALIDIRNDKAYHVYDAVLEGQEVLLREGWTEDDCIKTKDKQAIHFSHESIKLGYLSPGENAENRPEIIHRFLASWMQTCGTQMEEKQLVLGE